MQTNLFDNSLNNDLIKKLELKLANLRAVIEVKDICMKTLIKENLEMKKLLTDKLL